MSEKLSATNGNLICFLSAFHKPIMTLKRLSQQQVSQSQMKILKKRYTSLIPSLPSFFVTKKNE